MDQDNFYLTTKELGDKLIQSNDSQEVNDIVSMFNTIMQKKELIRVSALSDLQDDLTQQISKRVQKNSDCFSNKDLIDYFKAIQGVLDSQKNGGQITTPQIAIQNNVIVNDDAKLSKESRDRITDFVKNVLNKNQSMASQEIVDTI